MNTFQFSNNDINKFVLLLRKIRINKVFIKNYNDKSNERYFLEVDIQYPEYLHNLHNDLHFLPER